jgi:hypothetical protein
LHKLRRLPRSWIRSSQTYVALAWCIP